MLEVRISEQKCVGGGQCVVAAPDVFDQRDEDGIVILLQRNPDESLKAAVEEAAVLCPAAAITVAETAEAVQ